jgi:hypothetical protein
MVPRGVLFARKRYFRRIAASPWRRRRFESSRVARTRAISISIAPIGGTPSIDALGRRFPLRGAARRIVRLVLRARARRLKNRSLCSSCLVIVAGAHREAIVKAEDGR